MKLGRGLCVAFLIAAAWPAPVYAEWREASVGLTGGVALPAFDAPGAAAFPLATWTLGVEGLYGVTDHFSLRAAFATTHFAGETHSAGAPWHTGKYTFDAAWYHPEVGARYKLLGGYNWAPYIDVGLGWLWAAYAHGMQGEGVYAMPTPDKVQNHLTASVAVAVDYRLFNACFVGAAVRYVQVVGDALTSHFVTAPLYAAYYW